MKRYLIIIIHIAAWACLILLPIAFSPRWRGSNLQLMSEPFLWMLITMNVFLISFFYTNTEVFIPKLLAKKHWLWYSLVIIVCLILFIQIPRLFESAIRAEMPEEMKQKMGRRHRSGSFNIFNGSTAVFFLVFTISTCMKVMQQWLGAEKKQKEIENDKVLSELSYLKMQINPHFLFNTLNNIYSLAVVKSDATAGAVLKLSSIMRYVLNETKNDWVSLENEIKFINDFIELQRVRLTDKVQINFVVEGAVEHNQIAPLVLIPFVENAFKYGISAKESSAINILIKIKKEAIIFSIENNIVANEIDKRENTGIGLKNTRRRLELLYPEKHQLVLKNEDNKYFVNLTLYK